MGENRRALAIRWHQTEKEKEELKKGKEMIKQKQRDIMLRKGTDSGEHNSKI